MVPSMAIFPHEKFFTLFYMLPLLVEVEVVVVAVVIVIIVVIMQ
jgi:hypothetical protein